MSQLDLSDITKTIEQNYYCKNLHDYFHYPVDFMIKLLVIMTYRKIAYRHVKSKITEEDITHLLPSKSPFWLPSPSTIHHFVKYRLGEEGIELLMYLIGKKIAHYLKNEKNVIIDSTPQIANHRFAFALVTSFPRQSQADTVQIVCLTSIMKLKWTKLIS